MAVWGDGKRKRAGSLCAQVNRILTLTAGSKNDPIET